MYSDLHVLKLVLPARPVLRLQADGKVVLLTYTWPCGCSATGIDDAALALHCCDSHTDVLTPGSAVRS